MRGTIRVPHSEDTGPEPVHPRWLPESVLEYPMISLPLILILAFVGFVGLMVAIAGTGRRSRGAHRA